ncbi:MAG: thiamine phosphate synthase [Pseudomonadota bacterium]
MPDTRIPRLYLVTPHDMAPAAFADRLCAALATDTVACVRLSIPAIAAEDDRCRAADLVRPVCHEADVPLVIEEHHRLVVPLGLDGVHLRSSRASIGALRRELGKDRIIGADGGTERHKAMTLAEAGADYVTLGPIRAPAALGNGVCAEDGLFHWWSEMIEVPAVAEGGVTLGDAARLGPYADFAVPDETLWQAEDIAAALRAFAAALATPVPAAP